MRLRNDPDAWNKLKESGFLVTNRPLKIDHSFVVELGMGKGEMITALAYENINKQYLGVEKFATVAAKAARRGRELGLNNFFIICDDIMRLTEIVTGQVATIWLTFSDPWPKKRHASRRLTHKNFLDIYRKLLLPDGVLRLKTDNDAFFMWSIESMANYGMKLTNVTHDFHSHLAAKDNVQTGYERKWSAQGKKINYLEATFS